MPRPITHHYRDPVDEVWLHAVRRLGLRVVRSHEVFASYDGSGELTVALPEHLDEDDSLAQMLFHELCHAVVQGKASPQQVDWGLGNSGEDDELVAEHACHRLQAELAGYYGLRDFFAVTTEHRSYWDILPERPLAAGTDPAIALARSALERLKTEQPRWDRALREALEATATIAAAVREHVAEDSLWRRARRRHRAGFPVHSNEQLRCGECAWSHRGPAGLDCKQTPEHSRVSVDSADAACERWEARFDSSSCGSCGACCREGFDVVEVPTDDPFRERHPELVRLDVAHDFACVPRPNGKCVALTAADGEQYRCRVYAERPQSCADFEVRGDACLEARRRVGLSRGP